MAYLQNGRFVAIHSVPSRVVHNFAEESPGSIWVNDQQQGLLHLVEGKLTERFPWSSFWRADYTTALVPDRKRGGLWVGSYQGAVAYFKDGGIRASYGPREGLGERFVTDLRQDADGTLWVASEGGGLSRMKDGHVDKLTSRNGLPCDGIHWVEEDDEQARWLNTRCGLVRIDRTEWDAWAADPKRVIRTTVFDNSDGVTLFSNPGGYTPRVAKSRDGRIWFWGLDGVSIIDPRRLATNKLPPPVQVEQITADRKIYWQNISGQAASPVTLPPLVRDLEIDYTALSLAAPEKIRFKYKLEGEDRDWQEVGNRRQAFYNDLPPRSYRFRVMASNNSGVWNEAGAVLDFSIAPAYYQTGWFLASLMAATLLLLAGLYQLRLRFLNRQFNLRMEERVNERTRIARDLHDTLLQSFQGLLLKFHAVRYMLPDRPLEAGDKLEAVIEQARAAITEGRDAVQGLRTSALATNDLAEAIQSLGEELSSSHAGQNPPNFGVQVEGTPRDLAPILRDELYGIAAEALRNAFRHAHAKRLEVEIRYGQRQLRMRVRDDGAGIDPGVLKREGRDGHFGLPGMHERAKVVGGKLSIWSELRSGTEIELTIPAAIAYAKPPAATVSSWKGSS